MVKIGENKWFHLHRSVASTKICERKERGSNYFVGTFFQPGMFPTFFAVLARSAAVTCQPNSHNNLQIIQLFLISNFLLAKLKDPTVTAMAASVFSAAAVVQI